MKVTQIAVLILLIVLSFGSGFAKISLQPQEIEFFQNQMGFSNIAIMAFGATQLLAGGMLISRKARKHGGILLALTLGISLLILVLAAKYPMAIITLMPLVMLAFLKRQNWAISDNKSQ